MAAARAIQFVDERSESMNVVARLIACSRYKEDMTAVKTDPLQYDSFAYASAVITGYRIVSAQF